mmetsp:Transcript_19440/g.29962  ORF Transcript_19440/g.29962 Transcript_19440/m.29962 type:complete len:90 (+) Transcript_19440:758-1027(+)
MTQDRIALLEEVDFAWTAKSPEEQVLWEERLAQLREYKAEYGNCLVPRSYSANSQLGAWVHYQRCCGNGRLTKFVVQRLGKLKLKNLRI